MNIPKRLLTTVIAGTTVFALSPGSINAAITYVDATWGPGGNTELAGGAGDLIPTLGAVNDDNWDVITSYGNGGSNLQSNATQDKTSAPDGNGSTTENAPLIATTINNLDPGEMYDIYVYFWGNFNTNRSDFSFRVVAGVEYWDLTLYAANPNSSFDDGMDELAWALLDQSNGDPDRKMKQVGPEDNRNEPVGLNYDSDGIETDGYFTNDVVVYHSGTTSLYEARLGQVEADPDGKIVIYIDDYAGGNQKWRSTYDGVGYSAVIPEPSVSLLAFFGSLLLLRRRR